MNQPIVIVNLFFVPTLALSLFRRFRGTPLTASLELLFSYCAAVSGNLVLTKILLYFPKTMLDIYPPMDSALYTLAAMISACILALAALILGRIQIEVKTFRIEAAYENSRQENEY